MIIHDVVQGSEAWLRLRMGKPTASEFDRIITPKGNPCGETTSQKYINELLGELIMGRPSEKVMTALMSRGKDTEAEARAYYTFQTDRDDIREVGFCTRDDGLVGASPDALVGTDRGLEIKIPGFSNHCQYLFSKDAVGGEYKPQVQGSIYVCERDGWDTISYYPGMPDAFRPAYREEKFIKTLEEELEKFLVRLAEGVELIKARGWLKAPEPKAVGEGLDWLGITDEDVEDILELNRQRNG